MLQKFYIILLMISVISITGCSEDFLETTPTDAIAAGDALSSPANMELVLNGLHRQLYSQSPLPGGASNRAGNQYFIPMFDALTGDLIHSSGSTSWLRSNAQWKIHINANSTDVKQFWYHRYHYIASTNAIINAVADQGLTIDEEMNNILGQCYAYRAWAYHQLVSTYAKGYLIGNPSTDPGIPLLLATEAPYTSAPRSTVEVIYNQIEQDINQSIAYFENATVSDNKSHLSMNAAYGIKARIALSKGDWATAASAAVKARDGFPLLDEADWLSGFNTCNLSEVIWGGTVIDSETTYYKSYFYLISPTFNGGPSRSDPKLVNAEKYDQIPETDYRHKAFLPLAPNTNSSASNSQGGSYKTDPNYDNEIDFENAFDEIISTYGMTTKHNTHPYMHVKFLNKNPGTIDPDDVIYMRSSEMYLIEAEAKAMISDVAGAQAALKLLVDARDSAYDVTAFDTKDKLMTEIKFQRYVELYGEGFSWHDHIRWDEGIDLTNSGASEVLYQNGYKQEKPSVNDAWIWKIPQAEIDANPNLTEADQN